MHCNVTALRCNLETILGEILAMLECFIPPMSGVGKNGDLMGEVESIEEKLWKVEIGFE